MFVLGTRSGEFRTWVPNCATLSGIYLWQRKSAPQFAVLRLASWPPKCTSEHSGPRRQYYGVRRKANGGVQP
jgi:hypothetical protein